MSSHAIPNDPFTQELQRIRRLIGEGQLQAAAQALNEAQRRAPRDARVPLVGMRLAQQTGHIEGAITAARRALKLAPGWPVAQLELGTLLSRHGQPEEAMRLARDAVTHEPNDPLVVATAVGIAHACNDKEQMVKWAQRGLELRPDATNLRMLLGRTLIEQGRHADAQPHFAQLEQQLPGDANVHLGLMSCAQASGDSATAQRHADRALAAQPDDQNVRYWHAVAHGQTPPTQPAEVIASRFDAEAADFNEHLVRHLQYRVPGLIGRILKELHPDLRFNLLDLGCGTGLVGGCVGRIEGHIIGVDLSERMIAEAAQLNVYSRFHCVNLLDALRDTPAEHYEAITCADVLTYVGDLVPVAAGALRVLTPGGHFIFSCEATQDGEPDLVLRATERYAHRDAAVERICREAGFDDVQIEQLPVLRMEGNAPLPGFLVTARKPAA
jgi:predicted TPR repeat methyltransferase